VSIRGFACGDSYVWGGPTGRRCQTCGQPVPMDLVPGELLDGSLEILCRKHDEERAVARNAFLRSRISAKRSA
jgi:hypothetical protein